MYKIYCKKIIYFIGYSIMDIYKKYNNLDNAFNVYCCLYVRRKFVERGKNQNHCLKTFLYGGIKVKI